jgi:hypothetical protein
MYNAHGNFSCDDPELMAKLSEVLDTAGIVEVEGYFKGTIYYTPGRIMTLDPADAYPDEYEDDRFLEELICYTYYGETIDFNLSDGDALELAQEVLEEVIYDTEATSLREREEPYEW